MTALHAWFARPVATVHIDATLPWNARSSQTSAAPKPSMPPFWANVLESMRQPKQSVLARGLLGRLFAGRRATKGARVAVLDRVSLGQKSSLLLVDVAGSRMVVGVGADGTPSITPLRRPVQSAGRNSARPRTAARLRARGRA